MDDVMVLTCSDDMKGRGGGATSCTSRIIHFKRVDYFHRLFASGDIGTRAVFIDAILMVFE